MKVEPEAGHLHFQKWQCDLDKQEVCHHHLRPVLVREYADFCFERAKVTCFFG